MTTFHRDVTESVHGFMTYVEFNDCYGATIRVKQSSADPLDKCWVFIDGGALTGKNKAAAHLDPEQATELRDAITRWLKTQRPVKRDRKKT